MKPARVVDFLDVPFVVEATTPKEANVKYALLIYSDEAPDAYSKLSEDEQKAIMGEYMAISQARSVTGAPSCSRPRPRRRCASQDGRTLTTDGPFAETKEALGGYYLFEADDLDAAIELAARVPAARMGGAVEVRPLRGALSAARAGLPRRVGPRARHADRLPRRLRPRRGGRPGGVRDRRRALAARRRPATTRAPG